MSRQMDEKLVFLSVWASSYGNRVRVALAEKGVEYEYKEENLVDKSSLLLEMNPVFKKVPVLIHNGKPICESLIIVQYIDDVWDDKSPFLPSDPYQRARARFWAHYADKKIYGNAKNVWKAKGEEQELVKKEFLEGLKTMEAELGDSAYFGGESFGFVDVVLVPISCWFYALGICANFNVETECPKLNAWVKRCMERESVYKSLPDPLKIYEFVLQLKKTLE